jgi:hypothetical protein
MSPRTVAIDATIKGRRKELKIDPRSTHLKITTVNLLRYWISIGFLAKAKDIERSSRAFPRHSKGLYLVINKARGITMKRSRVAKEKNVYIFRKFI